jgi:hypothetical protein
MTAAPLARRAPVGVSKPAGTVRFSPAYEANARRTLAHDCRAGCYGRSGPSVAADGPVWWPLPDAGRHGDRPARRPLIALAELPIPAEARQRATELARWREEERQRRERRQRERADWRHEHTTKADTL